MKIDNAREEKKKKGEKRKHQVNTNLSIFLDFLFYWKLFNLLLTGTFSSFSLNKFSFFLAEWSGWCAKWGDVKTSSSSRGKT